MRQVGCDGDTFASQLDGGLNDSRPRQTSVSLVHNGKAMQLSRYSVGESTSPCGIFRFSIKHVFIGRGWGHFTAINDFCGLLAGFGRLLTTHVFKFDRIIASKCGSVDQGEPTSTGRRSRWIDNTQTQGDGNGRIDGVTTKELQNVVTDVRATTIIRRHGTVRQTFDQRFFLDFGPLLRFCIDLVVVVTSDGRLWLVFLLLLFFVLPILGGIVVPRGSRTDQDTGHQGGHQHGALEDHRVALRALRLRDG
mmetsp:Transcript_1188/g.2338  ORF Transcript_1188/g.2338 Transcript_1188/m.2338 type:complete len:250 (-) Transcript_1188:171-920(-)